MPNGLWTTPTPTVPRTTIAGGPVYDGEQQTLGLGAASAGSVTLTFAGQTTGAIAFNANAAAVQAALVALSNIAPGDVTVTGGPLPGTVTITFGGAYKDTDVPLLTATPSGLTGGTVTIATTRAGASGQDSETPAQRKVDQQWRDAVRLNLHKEHPDSLNATAPGEDF